MITQPLEVLLREMIRAREARKLGADADAGSPPLNVGNEAVNGSGPNDLAVQPNPIDVQRDGAMEAAPLEEQSLERSAAGAWLGGDALLLLLLLQKKQIMPPADARATRCELARAW